MKNVFFYVSLKHSILYAYYTLENLYFRLRPALIFFREDRTHPSSITRNPTRENEFKS